MWRRAVAVRRCWRAHTRFDSRHDRGEAQRSGNRPSARSQQSDAGMLGTGNRSALVERQDHREGSGCGDTNPTGKWPVQFFDLQGRLTPQPPKPGAPREIPPVPASPFNGTGKALDTGPKKDKRMTWSTVASFGRVKGRASRGGLGGKPAPAAGPPAPRPRSTGRHAGDRLQGPTVEPTLRCRPGTFFPQVATRNTPVVHSIS